MPAGPGRPMIARPALVPFGDAAVLIDLGGDGGIVDAARAQAVAARIRLGIAGRPGWGAATPAATSVLVHVDPVRPGVPAAIELLAGLVGEPVEDEPSWPPDAPPLNIPVRYGGEDGPDLDDVATRAGLTPAAVIELHSAALYRVLFLGFAPGFAYLGPLPEPLVLPRRASPRTNVPAGSVAIAGPHSAVYPVASPGGWHVLGRTAARLWDPRRDPPAILAPGAAVRFVPARDR
jgi:KipI family sensor histidine kinase inhibitor